jgi:hypothetical protein
VRGPVGAALLALALAATGLSLSGCGGGTSAAPGVARLERGDFLAVARALEAARPSVDREAAAAKAAWRLIANGLPAAGSASGREPILAAGRAAGAVKLPPLFEEREAAAITGPGSSPAGLFRVYVRLSTRGWALIGSFIDDVASGSAVSARFAARNVALYIESIYDAHFGLAQIGKQLLSGYAKLGGAGAFGSSLTQAHIDALAGAYSEARYRLHPHVGVRLGS